MSSAPCRRPVASPAITLPAPSTPNRTTHKFSAHQVADTLDQLIAMGLVEKFVDDHRITRYRPTGGRIA